MTFVGWNRGCIAKMVWAAGAAGSDDMISDLFITTSAEVTPNGGWVMESHPKWPSNKLPRYIMWYHLETLWHIIPPSRCMYDTCMKNPWGNMTIFEEFPGNKKTPGSNWVKKVSQSFRQHSSHVGLCALEIKGGRQAGECEFFYMFFLDKWGENSILEMIHKSLRRTHSQIHV